MIIRNGKIEIAPLHSEFTIESTTKREDEREPEAERKRKLRRCSLF